MKPEQVKKYLEGLGIKFKTHKHPPVYTAKEAEKYWNEIKGIHSKNLFLKSDSGRFFLAIIPCKNRLDMKKIDELAGEKVRFGDETDLKQVLGIEAGSVSPFALLNDKEGKTRLLIDKEVWEADFDSFHPCINTETLELSGQDFRKFIRSLKNKYEII